MQKVTVIIPNLNGMRYLGACLDSLCAQSTREFSVILIDNGSEDGSADFVRKQYPNVQVCCFEKNLGFCRAVNEGIRLAKTDYVILLNNDTVCQKHFVEEMVRAIERTHAFSCAAKIVQMEDPKRMDDAGDLYCAFGWAFALGKGKPAANYTKERRIFAACAAAAIYRRDVLMQIGLFDEAQFAYLEDIDVAYRARIAGWDNYFAPKAVVRHAGSATSGSAYNPFKTRYSAQNSLYLIYKNMPWPQILLNSPFLLAGFFIKFVFYARKGYLKEYTAGLGTGIALSRKGSRIRFRRDRLRAYVRIQLELWGNLFRRFG